MKQAQKMQNDVARIEKELNETDYEGQSGPVKVTVKGSLEVTAIDIDAELLEADNKEELQDMLMLALNEAIKKAKSDKEAKMGAVTAGISLPGVF